MTKYYGKDVRTTLVLGKCDWNGRGRRINEMDLELSLRPIDKAATLISGQEMQGVFCYETLKRIQNPFYLAISGHIWMSSKYDAECCGQIREYVLQFFPTKQNARIVEIWKEYHLNDTMSGTKLQVDAVNEWRKTNGLPKHQWDYEKACEYLKSVGLYKDRGVTYGTVHLYKRIPAEILEEIQELFCIPQDKRFGGDYVSAIS